MMFTLGFIIVGLLLIVIALVGSRVQRLPLSTAMLYVVVGVLIGPAGLALIRPGPARGRGNSWSASPRSP